MSASDDGGKFGNAVAISMRCLAVIGGEWRVKFDRAIALALQASPAEAFLGLRFGLSLGEGGAVSDADRSNKSARRNRQL
jgi:hypothetical protein